MAIYYADGPWSYRPSTGASTHLLGSTQRLLGLRAFANGSDGTFSVATDRTSTSGATTAAPIMVRAGFGFDWSPSGKVTRAVVTCSASIDLFLEIESLQ